MLPIVAWLLRTDGRRYRAHAHARVFTILYQPREDALWSTVTAGDGSPVTIAIGATADAFLKAIGGVLGSYQLVPRDHSGRVRGDPPQRIDLRTTTAAAALIQFRAPRAVASRRRPHPHEPAGLGRHPAIARLRGRSHDDDQ